MEFAQNNTVERHNNFNITNAQYVKPELVCTVEYLSKTESGNMRHPVFKGLKDDVMLKECIIKH